MQRKLVQQGAGTLMASLPAKWIKQNDLEKGDAINVEEVNGELIISTKKRSQIRQVNIELHELTESAIRTLITNTYRAGYDLVHVQYTKQKQVQIIETVLQKKLLGFDIVKQTPTSLTIQSITEPAEERFESIHRKVFNNAKIIAQCLLDKQKRVSSGEDPHLVEDRLQKYDNFCRRVIAKNKLHDTNAEFLWSFMSIFVHAQRELYLAIKADEIAPQTIELLEEIMHIIEEIETAFIKKDTKALQKIHSKEKVLIYNNGYELLKKHCSVTQYHCIACVRQLYLSTSPLMGYIILSR